MESTFPNKHRINQEDLAIRKCTKRDIPEFISIILNAFDDKFPIIFKTLDKTKYYRLMTEIQMVALDDVGESGNGNYLVFLKNREKEAVAAFRLYHKKMRKEPWRKPWKVLRSYLGLFQALRSGFWLQVFSQGKVKNGELYIDAIGVNEKFRGRGIGRIILHVIEKLARGQEIHDILDESFNFLSLYVSTINERAIALYKSEGFKIIFTRKSRMTRRNFGIPGFYYMKKDLIN
ncbi:MAG: GNAT family N-acetyltransferase [Promethearchaeota archaeon]